MTSTSREQALQGALEALVREYEGYFEGAPESEALVRARTTLGQVRGAFLRAAGVTPVYAFRRKGQTDFCTCSEERYNELAQKPQQFEVQMFVSLECVPAIAEQAREEHRQELLSGEADEQVGWRTFDGEGGFEFRSFEDNETYQQDFLQRNGDRYKGWVEPVYLADALAAKVLQLTERKNQAYFERSQVVAALAKLFPGGVAEDAKRGLKCVYLDLPTGQVSWHFLSSHAYLFDHLSLYAGAWDGHDTPEKYRRLAALSGQGFQGVAFMREMTFDDGRKGWFLHTPKFYCDIEPDPQGHWSVFFRDASGAEAYAVEPLTPPVSS